MEAAPFGVVMAIAEPLPVTRCAGAKPTDAEIKDLNDLYAASLAELFERTKPNPEARLVIM